MTALERVRTWPQLQPGADVRAYLGELHRALTEESAERLCDINPMMLDYEPTVTGGTAAQYWRGDKSWQTLNQAAVSGLTVTDSPTFGGMGLAAAAANANGSISTYSADTAKLSQLLLRKSASNTLGQLATTVSGDILGAVQYQGVNAAGAASSGAQILAVQDGAAETLVPATIRMYTADGASSRVALSLTKSGGVHVGGTADVADDNIMIDGLTASLPVVTDANKVLTSVSYADFSASLNITGRVPEGTIVAWNGGYYANNANGGYTFVLGTANSVSAVNALLNPAGWYVCDGAALNLATSTIFNGAGRYLPNLTDDRFLAGSTAIGATGGASTMAHTHGFTKTTSSESSHKHGVSINTASESSHTHSCNPPSTTSGAPSATAKCQAGDTGGLSVAGSNHTHTTDVAAFTSGAGSSHGHSVSGDTGAGTAHSHSVSGDTMGASNTENRPNFLSVFFITYVLAA
jgi:hypothetical protein